MTYTVDRLKALENARPNNKLIVEYRDADGYSLRGLLVSAYTSLNGKECANVNNFANVVCCDQIYGHYYENN